MILAITIPAALVLIAAAASNASTDIRAMWTEWQHHKQQLRLEELAVQKAEALHAAKCPKMTVTPRVK
mgnify:CR=1 FL=1